MERSSQTPELTAILRDEFGLAAFKPGQEEAIRAALAGQRVLVIQPTGWGKSLIYQMIARLRGLTLVFSPLRALMRDQMKNAVERYGLRAETINSDMSSDEHEQVFAKVRAGSVDLLFVSPERLDNADWQRQVRNFPIRAVVVDEAHCISAWGHDFRPDFRRIVNLIQMLPQSIPVIATTATATPRVEWDVKSQIGEDVKVLRGPLQRRNFRLQVIPAVGDKEKLAWAAHLIHRFQGSGVVYCGTRQMTELTADFLNAQGISAMHYHAGRHGKSRQELEKALLDNRYRAIASTNALGMGFDKPDLRFVIHMQFPGSPLHYYQEIGRAGRDGAPAEIALLYDPEDRRLQEHFIQTSKPGAGQYERIYTLLQGAAYRQRELEQETGFPGGAVKNVLYDLQDQGLVGRDSERYHRAISTRRIDFSSKEELQRTKVKELDALVEYVTTDTCRMAYLCRYLGDEGATPCGVCDCCFARTIGEPGTGLLESAAAFASNPRLSLTMMHRKAVVYEDGYALDYYGGTRVGEAVRSCKYEGGGPIPNWVVVSSVAAIRKRFPCEAFDAVIAIPPTQTIGLVEDFADRLAQHLGIPSLGSMSKVRATELQKSFTNRTQKRANVTGVFQAPPTVWKKKLLIVDDVCDSGITLGEAGKAVKDRGAGALFAFTIAKTRHRDDL